MKPTLTPRDTVISIKTRSLVGRIRRPRLNDIVVLSLPWEHDLIGVKRLVARPGEPWTDGESRVNAGPGWVVVGDEPVLSTDSRHHGRVPEDAIRGVVIARVGPDGQRVQGTRASRNNTNN